MLLVDIKERDVWENRVGGWLLEDGLVKMVGKYRVVLESFGRNW